jgi:hypothetical protein
MFLVCETAKSDGVEDGVALVNGLNGDVDGVHRGVFVHVKFRNEARASPQIWDVAPYAFNFCVDGLVTDDNANVHIMTPTKVVEQSVDSDRSAALASLGGIADDVEHF